MRLESVVTLDDSTRDIIYRWMREYNVSKNPACAAAMEGDAVKPLVIIARNAKAEVVGGLIGDTLFDWLRAHVMAVNPEDRNNGVGARLLAQAEKEARGRGCSCAYVDTMSFQAPEFYLHSGYSEVGRIANWDSHGHTKHFFTKQL